jgi:tRNA(Ile)-lysidine synthase
MEKAQEKVRHFILTHQLLSEGARVVVGLSGGPDSVCLALLLNRLGYEVVAAHCNFHLRGDESTRDERFVAELCKRMGWKLWRTDFDTEGYAQRQKMSIEMAARELRYEWFRQLKEETQAEAIAVGHHQDDNVETMLLNLTRGTGIRGLCGMQPRNADVVRPMLCLTREEILTYLQNIGQDYVTDHTNLEDAYARNKVRLDVLPLLERINQGAAKNLASTMENLTEVMQVYQAAIREAISQCVEHKANGEIFIHIDTLRGLPSPISVLHEALSPFGFNKVQMKQMLPALNESGKVFVSAERRVLIDRQHIIVEAEHYHMPHISQEVIPVENLNIEKDPRVAYLDADKLHHQLTLRTPKEGDTFAPFGMGGKRKLLSDFLTDQKLNLFEKERQPLLMDGEEIAWVVGRRSSELYRVDEHTKRVLQLFSEP